MFNSYRINTLQYAPELCIGCSMCWNVCPHGVFKEGKVAEKEGKIAELVNPEACMECGACSLNCPVYAIAVRSGVGCAAGMIRAAITGRPNECCDDPKAP